MTLLEELVGDNFGKDDSDGGFVTLDGEKQSLSSKNANVYGDIRYLGVTDLVGVLKSSIVTGVELRPFTRDEPILSSY